MKSYVPLVLIVVGALLVLGPIAAHEYSKERSRDQIAAFYTRNGNASVLPPDMQTNYGPYDYICLIVGIGTLGLGVIAAGADYFGVPSAIREMMMQRN